MTRIPPALVVAACAALFVATVGAKPPWKRGGFKEGDVVAIQGRVLDAEGRPVEGVDVHLEVARRSYSLRHFEYQTKDTLAVPGRTDADGRYRFDWRWNPYYNVFHLVVATPTPEARRTAGDILHREDVTERVEAAAPPDGNSVVDVPLTVASTDYLAWLRRFTDGRASADQKRIFDEMGSPDRLDLSGAARGEASWWYFRQGKVYRFRDGRLDGVTHFDPVEPLAADSP